MLTPAALPALRKALEDADVDGWLLFDFHGANPIAAGVLGLTGMTTRRVFAWIPREGTPVAITHAIEQGPWQHWPAEWRKEVYSSWRSLEAHLGALVHGRRVAMEYSPGDAVPYLDRIPAGVLELVRGAGAGLSSAASAAWCSATACTHPLTSQSRATWSGTSAVSPGR